MNMLKAEFHLHTHFSIDCRTTARTVVASCIKRGINCLFVTDHNQIDGAFEIQKIAPFKVIPSEEITTSEGEIIGYFLKEKIEPYLTPEETIRHIRAQGGLVSIPHPFDRLRHSRMHFATLERIIDQVDMLEVFNARNVFPSDDAKALVYARKKNKLMIVASDAHSRWEPGTSFMELPEFSDAAGLLRAVQKATLHKRRSFLGFHAITKWNKIAQKKP